MLKTLRENPTPHSRIGRFVTSLLGGVSPQKPRFGLPDNFAYTGPQPRSRQVSPPDVRASMRSLRPPVALPSRMDAPPRLYPKLPSYEEVMASRREVQKSLDDLAGNEKVNHVMRQIYPDPRLQGTAGLALGLAYQPAHLLAGRAWDNFRSTYAGASLSSPMALQAARIAAQRATRPGLNRA